MGLAFGAFGKMPALGDFFRVSAPKGFVEPWDTWVQQGILAGREGLGARWNDCYLSAPIWRFTLAPGLAGPAPMLGVMMASVDRVGRQFPLTLVSADEAAGDALCAHIRAAAVFAQLEGIALDALDDGMTREALTERLAAVTPDPAAALPPAVRRRSPGLVTLAGGVEPDGFADLAVAELSEGFRAPSVWSTGIERGTRLMICEGMPDAARMSALFDLDAAIWQEGDDLT